VLPGDQDTVAAVITTLGRVFEDGKQPSQRRLQAAVQLGRLLTQLGQFPTQPTKPKLPVIQALTGQCRKVYRDDPDAGMQAAAAFVLGHLHREAHAVYLPDTNAKDYTVALYRKSHQAAAHASQTLVIYPLTGP